MLSWSGFHFAAAAEEKCQSLRVFDCHGASLLSCRKASSGASTWDFFGK